MGDQSKPLFQSANDSGGKMPASAVCNVIWHRFALELNAFVSLGI